MRRTFGERRRPVCVVMSLLLRGWVLDTCVCEEVKAKMAWGTELEAIRQLAREVAEGHGLQLYDLELGQQRGRAVLRVYVDREGAGEPGRGVTVGECEAVSRELGQLMDVEEPLPFAYLLEVSSPGIERPLTELHHYRWAVGQRVRLVLDPSEGGDTVEGQLEALEEQSVRLRLVPVSTKKLKKGQIPKIPPVDEWEVRRIPMGAILKARTGYVS